MADQETSPTAPAALSAALQRLLRPLVRLMLRYGVTHKAFVDISRQVFVDVAAEDFELPGRRQTIQRISMLTGIPRKEVARRREQPLAPPQVAHARHNRAGRVLSGWLHDGDFHDPAGAPRPLSLDAGGDFAELIRRYSGDLGPRPVLDELVRVGAVEVDEGHSVRLCTQAYVPASAEADKLTILGDHVADLVGVIEHNLETQGAAFPQRQVVYDNIAGAGLGGLRRLARERADALVADFDAAMAAVDRDLHPELEGNDRHRVLVGFYYLDETVSAPPSDDAGT
jgi:hypothetical protein